MSNRQDIANRVVHLAESALVKADGEHQKIFYLHAEDPSPELAEALKQALIDRQAAGQLLGLANGFAEREESRIAEREESRLKRQAARHV